LRKREPATHNRDPTRRSAGLVAVAQDNAACLESDYDCRDAR